MLYLYDFINNGYPQLVLLVRIGEEQAEIPGARLISGYIHEEWLRMIMGTVSVGEFHVRDQRIRRIGDKGVMGLILRRPPHLILY